jgi:hypothetical protein
MRAISFIRAYPTLTALASPRRGVEQVVGGGGGLVLQGVGGEPLPGPAHPGAPLARGVGIFEQRKHVIADGRHRLPGDAARHLGAHDPARPRHQ